MYNIGDKIGLEGQELVMKKTCLFASLLSVLISGSALAAGGDMGTGSQPLTDGSESYPWLIEDLADFDTFADPNNAAIYWASGVHTKLTTDIDLSGRTYTSAVIAPDISTSSGFQGEEFSGTFDGNNFTLSNLTINGKHYLGLFGRVSSEVIKDLKLIDISINSTGGDYIGGLVGYLDSIISNCSTTGSVSGDDYIGGLIGYQRIGLISYSYCSTSVTGDGSVGGLVGYQNGNHRSSVITNCFSIGDVTGYSSVGAFIGNQQFDGIVSNCYSTGNVSGTSGIGGFVGHQHYGIINHCYATGNATCVYFSGHSIGGFVGSQYDVGMIQNCYSIGIPSGDANIYSIGGLAGSSTGGIINSFWDTQTSGITTSGGGKGRTTAQMMQTNNYHCWNTSSGEWTLNEGNDYPRLFWENQPGMILPSYMFTDFVSGTGSFEEPYLISTSTQLNTIGLFPNEWDKHFRLECDIDLSGFVNSDFNKIGINAKPFEGTFDGNNYQISNFTYNSLGSESFLGLFGRVDGIVKDLHLENANVSSTGGKIGAVVGTIRYSGKLENCSVTSTVVGFSYVGGLVGYHTGTTINNCTSISDVSGYGCIGGLAGGEFFLDAEINNCFSMGTVTGHRYSGGLVGEQEFSATISNCGSFVNMIDYSNSNSLGGLVGIQRSGMIQESYALGSVTGYENLGGLIGLQISGTVQNCYSMGNVTGYRYIGGLAGRQSDNPSALIDKCYSTGKVIGDQNIGGLVPSTSSSEGIVSYCLYDMESSGTTLGRGSRRTTEQMQQQATFTVFGWDFDPNDGDPADWMMLRELEDYPRLAWQEVFAGDIAGLYGADMVDFAYLATYWGLDDCDGADDCGRADIDGDGDVGVGDLAAVANDWLK